jgi:hypothetical protein
MNKIHRFAPEKKRPSDIDQATEREVPAPGPKHPSLVGLPFLCYLTTGIDCAGTPDICHSFPCQSNDGIMFSYSMLALEGRTHYFQK